MKQVKFYIKLFVFFHKKNIYLYCLLLLLIILFYIFQLPTPLSLILGDTWYWSRGLTRAAILLLNGKFSAAFTMNPLIYLVLIYGIYFIFILPVQKSKKNEYNFTLK